jgi:NADH:ubiquinone oxidoreductase subunit F (NADH-binding)
MLLDVAGGLHPNRTLRAMVMGGPSGGFLSPDLLDVPLVGGLVHPTGAVLGSGGVVVMDDRMPVSVALRELTAYNAAESCGKCTPCREGTARALAILDRADAAGGPTEAERAELLELCDLMQYASLCGLGQMAPGPIRSALALFP